MKQVYADTVYWIALANPLDQWHPLAVRAGRLLRGAMIVTSDEILIEFLAHFSGQGPTIRDVAARYAEQVLNNPGIIVRPQSHQSFLEGFHLYKTRLDKAYSLTDCVSMATMRQEQIADILMHDNHFVQEGFKVLL